MGSQICKNYKQKNFSNTQKEKELLAENADNQGLQSTGSQNLKGQQDYDECSPSSKFNIQFLNSSVRASQKSSSSKQLKYSLNILKIKSYMRVTCPKLKYQTRRSLLQWCKNIKTQKINSRILQVGEEKLKDIKSYQQFIHKKASQFRNIKISGDLFYRLKQQPIEQYYQINNKIGQGSFGSVYKGKCKSTGELRAIKILKKKIMEEKDQKCLISQISILKKMDHINIIKLYDVFYIKGFFYVVTEYCGGGSLNQILNNKQIKSQKDVAMFMRQIISAVKYMHQLKIAHRDLKLQNVVLVDNMDESGPKTCIKLIDFGLASKVQYSFRNSTVLVGTLDFMAPEIFSGFYSTHSDIWSCGVIMCMLLVGYNPFNKKQKRDTIDSIKLSQIDFNKKQWSKVSLKGKKLLSQMLNKKPEKRIRADQVLNHDWFKQLLSKEVEIRNSLLILQNFNKYHRGSNFMCYIKNFLISRQLSQSQRQQLALIFEKIDTDSSGVIQKDQLIKLYSLVAGTTDRQIQNIIQNIDQNKSGRIDFQQFLLCMTNDSITRNQKYINEAFDYFDSDSTGYIQKKELLNCLEGCNQAQIVKIIAQADFNGDQKISRDQFFSFMMRIQL